MKLASLVLLALCLGIVAHAQQFPHVIVIVQENRTPDNLFSYCAIPGADVQANSNGQGILLDAHYDLNHSHSAFESENIGYWPYLSLNHVEDANLQPYCDMATQYAFADRMFQTNQGPSMPAHQFLFSGTSAPTPPGHTYSDYYAAENAAPGCTRIRSLVSLIDPQGNESEQVQACFDHPLLSDLIEQAGLSWKYYGVYPSGVETPGFWMAPALLSRLCKINQKSVPPAGCSGPEWKEHVVTSPPRILNALQNGTLANISWVTPMGACSDHPADGNCGPAWVASIVNAVGQSIYWQNTAIIVVWDDWGGWWDHVAPLPNHSGFCESYCGGFRVPMLFISAQTPESYVSHQDMDFGSILQFIEQDFGLQSLGYADTMANPLDPALYGGAARKFQKIRTRRLTRKELADQGAPDSD